MNPQLSSTHHCFPLKEMKKEENDKPWITAELKVLKRKHQRIYRKEGRSPKYVEVVKLFEEKREAAISKYKEKIVAEVKEGKRSSAYKALRKLDPFPGKKR